MAVSRTRADELCFELAKELAFACRAAGWVDKPNNNEVCAWWKPDRVRTVLPAHSITNFKRDVDLATLDFTADACEQLAKEIVASAPLQEVDLVSNLNVRIRLAPGPPNASVEAHLVTFK
jgi:hypothetical protein